MTAHEVTIAAAVGDELRELEAEISIVCSASSLEDALSILVEEAEEAEET
jgi:hypothetical protein